MLFPRGSLALLLSLTVGCGARTVLDDTSADDDVDDAVVEPACTAQIEPRVEDCERASIDAVPLARITGDGFHLAADDESLYYTSDNNVFRLPMSGGDPEALTPGPVGGQGIQYANGFVYWLSHDDVVQRVPKAGGEPEPLIRLAHGSVWAVADPYLLSAGPPTETSPLVRTSLVTGETSELLAVGPEQKILEIGVADGWALVALSDSLVRLPLSGGAPELLAAGSMTGAPRAHDGHVYFGSLFPEGGVWSEGIFRVEVESAAEPELFLRGFPVAYAFDGEALYGHVIPGPEEVPGERVPGRLVRAPLEGGAPEQLTFTSAYRELGYTVSSNGLTVSGCNVYFIERCGGATGSGYRLVTMSKLPGGEP